MKTFAHEIQRFQKDLIRLFMILRLPLTSPPGDFNVSGISTFLLLSTKETVFIFFQKSFELLFS